MLVGRMLVNASEFAVCCGTRGACSGSIQMERQIACNNSERQRILQVDQNQYERRMHEEHAVN